MRIWTIPQGQIEQPLHVHCISSILVENINSTYSSPAAKTWIRLKIFGWAIQYVIGQIVTHMQARPPPKKLILKTISTITPRTDVKNHWRVWVYAGHASLRDRIRKGRQPAFWSPLVCITPPYFWVTVGTKDSNDNTRSVGNMNFINIRAILSCDRIRQRDNDVPASPDISVLNTKRLHIEQRFFVLTPEWHKELFVI